MNLIMCLMKRVKEIEDKLDREEKEVMKISQEI